MATFRTIDNSGEGEVFKILPDNVYGNIKLYAVWDNPNATAVINLFNSKTQDSTDTLEYKRLKQLLLLSNPFPDRLDSKLLRLNWHTE